MCKQNSLITRALIESVTQESFSHSAVVKIEDVEWGVVGRWCTAHYLPKQEAWDVWVYNTRDIYTGIGTRRLNNILRRIEGIKNPTPGPLRRLDGEALYPRMPTEVLLRAGSILGIKKRRRPPAHAFVAKINL